MTTARSATAYLRRMTTRHDLLSRPEVRAAVRELAQACRLVPPEPSAPGRRPQQDGPQQGEPDRTPRRGSSGDGIMGERVESLFVPK